MNRSQLPEQTGYIPGGRVAQRATSSPVPQRTSARKPPPVAVADEYEDEDAYTSAPVRHTSAPVQTPRRASEMQASRSAIRYRPYYVQESAPAHPVTEPPRPSIAKRSWYRGWKAYALGAGVMLVLILGYVLATTLLAPTATITIVPLTQAMHADITVTNIPGRSLAPVTLSQAMTISASATVHKDATPAHGLIVFYNTAQYVQTVRAGAILMGADGIQVVIDQTVTIDAAPLPTMGEAYLPAHALVAGASGNIAPRDINGPYAPSLYARNLEAFTGGQDARTFQTVAQSDYDNALHSLHTSLLQGIQATLQGQVKPGEALSLDACSQNVTSTGKPGDDVSAITVTVSQTCKALAYDSAALQSQAREALTLKAVNTYGVGYAPYGSITTQVKQVQLVAGVCTIALSVDGVAVRQFSQDDLSRLARLVAGKSKEQATALLLRQAGIKQAGVTAPLWGNLPGDPGRIRVTVVYEG